MIRRDISDINLDKKLHAIISREFDFISNLNPDSYVIKYGSGKYGDYIYLKLKQENSIYIDLCVEGATVDLLIGMNTIPIYEMDKVIKDKDIKWFEKLIKTILTKPLEEIEYDSGNIEFVNLELGETIFKSRNFFSFLWQRRIKGNWKYKPWIKTR